jgi:23S rRNA (cytosine1962-C5)-methyltransferase
MTELPIIKLHAGADRRVRRGHCWIYSNEVESVKVNNIDSPFAEFPIGQPATVVNTSNHAVGSAYFNPHTLLCGRIYSRSGDSLLKPLIPTRIKAAYEWREAYFNEPYYRLVYGDGDGLPGLVVDRYGDILVLEVTTAGMYQLLDDVVAALCDVLQPAGILLRIETESMAEQLKVQTRVLYGDVPEYCELTEHGVAFTVPLWNGQKTGWFYDHRDSRAYLRQFVQGKRVLDLYSYLGGWGMQALAGGASELVCVDRSAQAMQLLEKNLQRSGYLASTRLITDGAINAIKTLAAEGQQFDVIVLDPPAFIKRRKDLKSGEKAYHQVNQRAVKILKPGGVLVSASCSMQLTMEMLKDVVKIAAYKAGREASFVHCGGLGIDHPVAATIPEMDYLKTIFARIS